MTNLTIKQSTQSTETVTPQTIEKLYRLALTSKVEDENNDLTMDLEGNITASAAYEDSVNYLTTKFSNLIVSVNSRYIRFKDALTQQVCASLWGSDGTNLSIEEAAQARNVDNGTTILKGEFKNTSIVNFDEFKYFTGITQMDDIRTGVSGGFPTTLEKITLPPSLISLNGQELFGNTKIKTINLENVQRIGTWCFSNWSIQGSSANSIMLMGYEVNCPNLSYLGRQAFRGTFISKVINLGNITDIMDETFNKCTSLTEVTLPSNTVTLNLGSKCFQDCTALTTVHNLDKVTSFTQEGPFSNCTSLSNPVINLLQLQSIGSDATNKKSTSALYFSNSNVKQIYLPKLKVLPQGGYDNGRDIVAGIFIKNGYGNSRNSKQIIYLKDIETIQSGVFSGVTAAIVINNTTVPTIVQSEAYSSTNSSTSLFYGSYYNTNVIPTIYVPDSVVSAYKNAWQGGSNTMGDILPISDLQQYATEEDWIEAGQPVALITEYM